MQGDVSNLRNLLLSETFDVILSSLVLHYLAELTETFREWARLLSPSGALVFSTHHPIHQASLLDPGYLCTELLCPHGPMRRVGTAQHQRVDARLGVLCRAFALLRRHPALLGERRPAKAQPGEPLARALQIKIDDRRRIEREHL